MTSHTTTTLQRDLERAGIVAGQTLIVHASTKAIGPVEGGATAVVSAITSQLTGAGTLLMPTFSDPQPDGVFRVMTTPSRVGYLTEIFRTTPGVRRSFHPTHSVAAWGADADSLLGGHERIGGLSDGSPLHRAAIRGASVLMIGCGLNSCSVIHVAESLERVPYLGKVWYDGYDRPLNVDPGHGDLIAVQPKDPPTCSAAFERVGEALEAHGRLRRVAFGDATALLFVAIDAIAAARQLLQRDRLALLCDHPRCPVCTKARHLFGVKR